MTVGTKKNTYSEFNQDSHFLFARNKQRREFAELIKKDVIVISCDDMTKIKVEAPAVSRYILVLTTHFMVLAHFYSNLFFYSNLRGLLPGISKQTSFIS